MRIGCVRQTLPKQQNIAVSAAAAGDVDRAACLPYSVHSHRIVALSGAGAAISLRRAVPRVKALICAVSIEDMTRATAPARRLVSC